jgi:hypothetical protein
MSLARAREKFDAEAYIERFSGAPGRSSA